MEIYPFNLIIKIENIFYLKYIFKMNKINIDDENLEKINTSKFKDITLYDYQNKTIEKLLEHEKGQKKIDLSATLISRLYQMKYSLGYTKTNNRLELENKMYKFKKKFKKPYLLFDYNIGVLSNKVGSGKTFIILGLIMSRPCYKRNKVLQKYFIGPIYENTTFSYDICSVISEYLIRESDFMLSTSSNSIFDIRNIFSSTHLLQNNLVNNLQKINNLIILPHNLFQQWRDEIEQKTTLDCYFIKNKRDLRDLSNILNYDIVVCNVNKLKHFLTCVYDKYTFGRVFIDEVDTINLSNFPEINCDFLWLITTTYKRILNPKNQGFIRNLFNPTNKKNNFLYEYLLENLSFKFDSNYIDKKVNLKIPNKKYIVVKNNFINKLFYKLEQTSFYSFLNSYDYPNLYLYLIKRQSSLYGYMYMLRYIYSGYPNFDRRTYDANFINTHNNLNIVEYEDIHSVLILFLIKKLYDIYNSYSNYLQNCTVLQRIFVNIKYHVSNCPVCSRYHGHNKDRLSILSVYDIDCVTILEYIDINNCKTLNTLFREYKRTESLIKKCYNYTRNKIDIYNYIIEQLRLNNYCNKCLNRHKLSENCRDGFFTNVFNTFNINLFEDFLVFDEGIEKVKNDYKFLKDLEVPKINILNISNVSLNNTNLKIKHMINKLRNDIENKKRCLIFSDNYHFFNLIKDELTKNEIKNRVLKGNSNTINSILKKFKNYKIDVLLMNMKFSGSGINLQMSDNIYVMNMIDDNTETQVIGRVNRISKVDNFEINYFFNDDEYKSYNKEKSSIVDKSPKEEIIIEEI